MSTATGKRLDKIAANLTPRAAFLVWLQEVQEYPTMSAYSTALKDAPESAWPMYRLPHQAGEAVRLAHQGAKPEVLARLERQAVKKIVFLYQVHSEVNTRLMDDWRAMCLQIALAASHLGRLFEHETPEAKELMLTRHIALIGLTELLEWAAAVTLLAHRYFGDQSPLYPAWEEQLQAMVAEAETMATLFNEHLDWLEFLAQDAKPVKKRKSAPPPGEPIDLEALRIQTQSGGRELARHIGFMAQAEALRFMDEPRAALALVKRRLWPDAAAT